MPLTAHGEQSALRSHRTPNTAASTAPLPASVTIAIRPSGGVGCESCRFDLGQVATNIFRKIRKKDSTALPTKRPTGKSPHDGESKFRSCPGPVQRAPGVANGSRKYAPDGRLRIVRSRCSAEPGPISTRARWAPDQQVATRRHYRKKRSAFPRLPWAKRRTYTRTEFFSL